MAAILKREPGFYRVEFEDRNKGLMRIIAEYDEDGDWSLAGDEEIYHDADFVSIGTDVSVNGMSPRQYAIVGGVMGCMAASGVITLIQNSTGPFEFAKMISAVCGASTFIICLMVILSCLDDILGMAAKQRNSHSVDHPQSNA